MMETIPQITHKIKLVDNIFTPTEASDIITALIKEKINFHKLHRLSIHEGNCTLNTDHDDNRIAQLLQEKNTITPILKEALLAGKKIKINGSLEIAISH